MQLRMQLLTYSSTCCGSGGHTASQQEQTHRNSLLLRCSTYFFSQIAHPLPPRNEGTATGSMMNFSIRSPTTAQKDDGFSYGKTIPQKHKRGLLGKFSSDCQSEQGSIALLLSYGSQKGQTYWFWSIWRSVVQCSQHSAHKSKLS